MYIGYLGQIKLQIEAEVPTFKSSVHTLKYMETKPSIYLIYAK